MTSTPTNASLQTTIGRISILTRLRQAQNIAEMVDLWERGSPSAFTDETPAEILRDLTGMQGNLQPAMSDTRSAREWIADRVRIIEPTLTQDLIDNAHLISPKLVKRASAEFRTLEAAWRLDVINLHAGHMAMEYAAAVYPKLFPGRQITFLADDLMKLDEGSAPGIQETLDNRFRFIVNHVRDRRALDERFGLTEELVERSVAAGRLSTNPFAAIQRYQRKRAWLKVELGATIALVAGLVVGGFVSHARDATTLRNILWLLSFSTGLGLSALSTDRYLDHQRSDLFPKTR